LAHIWLAAFMAVLIFIRHHDNIRRLVQGEEPRIGKSGTPAPAGDDNLGHNGGPPLA
jgi:glycerol-3-phosphate acyltransferase PlsY